MARRKRNRRDASEILRQAYAGRARNLHETILSLLPPPPPSPEECRCRGGHCIGCGGSSHLLRRGDPSDYRTLLTRSYCVVSSNAPPPPVLYRCNGWSQRSIVRNSMELLMDNSQVPTNVLCIGYDQKLRFSDGGEYLLTGSWELLLTRIGDSLMVFLIKFSSIFMPLGNRIHHQVTGPPLYELLQSPNFICPVPTSTNQQSSCSGDNMSSGPKTKRRRLEFEGSSKMDATCSFPKPSNSVVGEPKKQDSDVTSDSPISRVNKSFNTLERAPSSQYQLKHPEKMPSPYSQNNNDYIESSRPTTIDNSKRHARLFSWQRRKKRKIDTENDVHTVGNLEIPSMCKHATTNLKSNVLPSEDNVVSKKNEPHSHSEMGSLCFNCLILQAPKNISTVNHIQRKYIFYSRFSSSTIFRRNHILNRVKPNDSGAISLMWHIFGFRKDNSLSCTQCNVYSINKSECLYHNLLSLLKALIRNVKHCQNRKLLNKHCLASSSEKCSKDCSNTGSEVKTSKVDNTIASYSTYHQVVSYIWAVIRRIIPLELLGDSSTWRALRKNIWEFVSLRRCERFSLKQCIHGLKTSCYPFVSKMRHSSCCCDNVTLKKASSFKMTPENKFFQCWIHWFFSYIIIPTIADSFYVTESEIGRNDVFYYPKPMWRKLVDRAVTCLTKQNFEPVDNVFLGNVLRKRTFGFSKIRFLPKEKNLRPLANLKAPSKMRLQIPTNSKWNGKLVRYRSVNSSLRELHGILRRKKVEHPEKLGSSVFDYNDIYQKLHHFVSGTRNGSRMMPKLFIVVADVLKAFDSIDQNLLIDDVMKDVIQNSEYHFRRYARILHTKNSMKVLHDKISYDHSNNQNDITKFRGSIQLRSISSIFVDKGISERIKHEELHYILEEHLKHNILQVGQYLYLQKVGIPQGSLLSSLLCSFYYGHLERLVIFPYLEKTHQLSYADSMDNQLTVAGGSRNDLAANIFPLEPQNSNLEGQFILSNTRDVFHGDSAGETGSIGAVKNGSPSLPRNLLMRLIDDFLFVSTSKEQATSFFNRLRRGFRKYNCFMNNEKFGLNFGVEQMSNQVNRIYTGEDHISFIPWSGLLLNCQTLEVQADYTRYLGVHISSTITVKSHAKVGYHLGVKLCDYMRPKCHPIFYDSNINSRGTVNLNAYQAFLLCAMKFHCYMCSLPDSIKLSSNYLIEIIERSFGYMYRLIKKLMHDMEQGFNIRPILRLKKVEIVWLGLSAYIRVLKRKHSRHKQLLSLLTCVLASHATHARILDASSHLKDAVDDSHSSVFWKIKF